MKLKLRKASTVVAAILFAFSLVNGQDKRVDLTAGNIEISMILPAGLQPFSEQTMALAREKASPDGAARQG